MQLFTLNIRRKAIHNTIYISHCFNLKYSVLQIHNEKVQHISAPIHHWRSVIFTGMFWYCPLLSPSHPHAASPKHKEPGKPWEAIGAFCCCCSPRLAAPCVALLCKHLVSLPFDTTSKNVHWNRKPLMKSERVLRKTWWKFNFRKMEKNIRITCSVL